MYVSAAEFFIAPGGSDNNGGTAEKPFAALAKARDTIREQRKTGKITADEAITVHLAAGQYFVNQSLELTKEDSGSETSPLKFVSAQPFAAEIIGGSGVPVSLFKKVSEPEVLNRLDKSIQNKIVVADLSSLKTPQWKEWSNQFRGAPSVPPELFFNNEPMTVARFPNTGWAGFKTALDSGLPHNEKTDEKTKKAEEKLKIMYKHPETDTTKRHGGAFIYDEEGLKLRDAARFERWNIDAGVWLCGYWTHDWSDEILRVASIDAKQKILQLLGIHGYGIGESSWAGYSERRFFALNLLEELDAPNEWYLDRKNNKLYFYPPKPFNDDDFVILSVLDSPLVKITDADYIQFQGISFGPTFGNAISIQGGTKCAVLGCQIRNTGRGGISLNGGTEHIVKSCDLYNIGATAVSINGGDRKTLTPANHLAENNHIHHFGRLSRTYCGAFGLQGVGNTVRNNKIHDAPHLAIGYGGNENKILRNEIYNVVQETSDAGAMYTGRDWTTQGNLIEENFVHHLGTSDSHGTMAVYLDDCDCGDTIRRNLFYKAGRAIFIGGGRDNTAVNNIIVDCFQGIALDSRGMTWKQWNKPDDGWHLEGKAEALNYKNPPWSTKYPKLAVIMDNMPQAPLGCVFEKNVIIDCKEPLALDGNVLKLLARTDVKDNVKVTANLIVENNVKANDTKLQPKEIELQKFVKDIDSGFVNPEKLDFHFKRTSALKRMLPQGFEPLPLDKIGIYSDEYRK
ncbi:hypothetical protein FACS18942_10320 [Planctomycetales bacterium]|nr:hypothetical protein FACS18942_10320 [Planctomycetales bacterium]